jgi:hypothetical protein
LSICNQNYNFTFVSFSSGTQALHRARAENGSGAEAVSGSRASSCAQTSDRARVQIGSGSSCQASAQNRSDHQGKAVLR